MEVIQMSTDSNVEPTTEATELTEEAEQENQGGDDDEDDDDDEEKILGPWGGIIAMVIATIFISILSQLIVDAVEGAAASLNIPCTCNFDSFVIFLHYELIVVLWQQRTLSVPFCCRLWATLPSTRRR
jgi:Ca2+/H+ antiporter